MCLVLGQLTALCHCNKLRMSTWFPILLLVFTSVVFKTFFICTFNASKVTFIHFLFEWLIACSFYRKTVWTDFKFLDGSVFKNRIWTEFRFSAHPYLNLSVHWNTWKCRVYGDGSIPKNQQRRVHGKHFNTIYIYMQLF